MKTVARLLLAGSFLLYGPLWAQTKACCHPEPAVKAEAPSCHTPATALATSAAGERPPAPASKTPAREHSCCFEKSPQADVQSRSALPAPTMTTVGFVPAPSFSAPRAAARLQPTAQGPPPETLLPHLSRSRAPPSYPA